MRNSITVAVGIALLSTVLTATAQDQEQKCADSSSSSWSDGHNTFAITQHSDNTITGKMQTPTGDSCLGTYFDLTGSYNTLGTGRFNIDAVNHSNPPPMGCANTINFNGALAKPGCNNATGTYEQNNGTGGTGQFTWHTMCTIPSGEYLSHFDGWADSQSAPTIAKWSGLLIPPGNYNFGGRKTTETNAGPATDGCFRVGDPTEYQVTGVTGGTWNVQNDNSYGDDYVGLLPKVVDYYRLVGRAPCSVEVRQTMIMDCDTDSPPYLVNNVLTFAITSHQVGSGRGGANMIRTYLLPL